MLGVGDPDLQVRLGSPPSLSLSLSLQIAFLGFLYLTVLSPGILHCWALFSRSMGKRRQIPCTDIVFMLWAEWASTGRHKGWCHSKSREARERWLGIAIWILSAVSVLVISCPFFFSRKAHKLTIRWFWGWKKINISKDH